MFAEMRAACSIPPSEDILDYIHSLPDKEHAEAFAKIQAIERKAMSEQLPQAGLVHLMEFLDREGVRRGICTRNFEWVPAFPSASSSSSSFVLLDSLLLCPCFLIPAVLRWCCLAWLLRNESGSCTDLRLRIYSAPVHHLLTHHIPHHLNPFDPIITRDFRPPKPSPAGILHIAHAWNLISSPEVPSSPRDERLLPIVMVGDSVDDMVAGYEAGALTVLLRSAGKETLEADERTDVVIDRYV